MSKFLWFTVAVVLFCFATYGLMNAVYWVIIGHDVEYGIGFIAGTFAIPLLLFYLTYVSWKKAGTTVKH